MPDDQVVRLLEEIRDLHKQQLENSTRALAGQQTALANQQEAIARQKQAMQRAKVVSIAVLVLFAAIFLLPAFWWGTAWTLRCLVPR
jgi:cytoskeletal protein RodZ